MTSCAPRLFLIIILLSTASFSASNEKTITIALDADRTRNSASALSIEMGIKTAFAEIENNIQGRKIVFMPMDHRGNSTRSKNNMKSAMERGDVLFILAGMHSSPLIKNRSFINENKILTLVPWAAGGPITRYPSKSNWVFRLSIDDTKAGIRIAQHAVDQRACGSPHLLLERTPWGESNRNTMGQAFSNRLGKSPGIEWFNWSVSESSMRIKLRNIFARQADCIIFVGNASDGETLANAMLSFDRNQRLPIYSHWGITGGSFVENIPNIMRSHLQLEFVQSCFSFVSSKKTAFSQNVFAQLRTAFPNIKNEKDLRAPAGFIHAYDLGKLVIQALSQVMLTQDMAENRSALKNALENINEPVVGLIKTYERPFSPFSQDNTDAHEALNLEDYCMAEFGADNEIIVF